VRVLKFKTDKVSTKIVDNVLMELIVLLNQNHTNRPFGCGDIKKIVSTVVWRLQ
jgi:hypothetical protein